MRVRIVTANVVGFVVSVGLAMESLAATEVALFELIERYSEQNDVDIIVSPDLQQTVELGTATLKKLDQPTFVAVLKGLGLTLGERGNGILVVKCAPTDNDDSVSCL
ncbi:MAG: hypothetical protein AAGH76_05175 [Pseudomonadota bacterium]